tara:strand:- start:10232 stop:10798 length:567 start_codon:yes stop_codon:yes gene_type:complete
VWVPVTKTTLTCDGCGNDFEKYAAEVTRQRKKNPDRRFFCTRKCYGEHDGKTKLGVHLGNGDTRHLTGRKLDGFSPFRYFLNKATNRKWETDLDLAFLKKLWEAQGGRCALSGEVMDLPPTTSSADRMKGNPKKASLDRIDNAKGYLRGNVRFITNIANMARQGWDDQTVVSFCQSVARYKENDMSAI